MRALLIEFDLRTGKRAGNINPKDPKLPCYGWQNLDQEPAVEIRLVEDGRDLSSLVGVAGVTILEDKIAINQAIKANIPTQYVIDNETLLLAHLKEKGISLDSLAGKRRDEVAKILFAQGIAGVREKEPRLL